MSKLFDLSQSDPMEPEFDPFHAWPYDHRVKQAKWTAIWMAGVFLGCLIASCHHTPALTASWYNAASHRLTAASWEYPFGTMVKVTNLVNGRQVVVLINDRGPATRLARKGRIIDLSREAFGRIASLDDGVIKIKTEIVK